MARLVPAIHAFDLSILKTWMSATSAGMTDYYCYIFSVIAVLPVVSNEGASAPLPHSRGR